MFIHCTLVHYNTVWVKDSLKVDPISVLSKPECIDCIENWPFMVIFLYNLDLFVLIQNSYLGNMVFTLGPSNCVI